MDFDVVPCLGFVPVKILIKSVDTVYGIPAVISFKITFSLVSVGDFVLKKMVRGQFHL